LYQIFSFKSRFLAITHPDYSAYDAVLNSNCFIRISNRCIYFSLPPKSMKKMRTNFCD